MKMPCGLKNNCLRCPSYTFTVADFPDCTYLARQEYHEMVEHKEVIKNLKEIDKRNKKIDKILNKE